MQKMVDDPAFDFGSHSVPVDRNEAIAKRPKISGPAHSTLVKARRSRLEHSYWP